MIDINYSRAIELIQGEIVKEGGKHTYRPGQCVNVEKCETDGRLIGSCLIGRALIAAGIAPEEFVELDIVGNSITNIVEDGVLNGRARIDPRAMRLMALVQMRQDDGVEWSLALELSIASLERDEI